MTPKNSSVGKAFEILRAIAASGGNLTASEIARANGGSVATVHRFLLTLEEEGAVARSRGGGYHLGPMLAELGQRVDGDVLLLNAARPHLDALAKELREVVHCVARSGNHAVNAAVALPDRNLLLAHPVGEPFPLHCTSAGKLFIASMAEEQRRRYLSSAKLTRFTARTIANPDELEREAARIAGAGFAVDDEEWEDGIRSIALPLRGRDGRVIAAIALSAPATRLTPDEQERARIAIGPHVAQIERSLSVESRTFPGKARPRGAYPHMKRVGDLVFLSGMSARRPDDTFEGVSFDADGAVLIDIAKQARYTFDAMQDMLRSSGASLDDVVDVQVFLLTMSDYHRFNAAYAGYFGPSGPARSTIAVAELPHPHQGLMVTAIVFSPSDGSRSTYPG